MLIHKKIDVHGNYLKFPGISVIACVGETDKDFWLSVYEFLNGTKNIRNYYSPLPCSSYHMTTNHLYTQSDYPDNWPTLLNDERFQHLHSKLMATAFSLTATVVSVKVSYALQLNLVIPPSQYALIKAIAEEFSIQNKIPQTFHVTLAYAYKELEDARIIAPEIEQLRSLCLNKEISLLSPMLCFFHDMRQFFIWDGKCNPFS